MSQSELNKSITNLYESLKEVSNRYLLSTDVPNIIAESDKTSRLLLSECEIPELRSLIPGKEYFVFKLGDKVSRPINKSLFDIHLPNHLIDAYRSNDLSSLNKQEIAALLYTLSMSFCAVIDLLHSGNKKTPATFFEKFIGNLFARELTVRPTTALGMLNDESLPTDYIFKTAH